MKSPHPAAALAICLLFAASVRLTAQETTSSPVQWAWAPTPPMGWNSYDAWGTSITEDEFLANARYMRDHLLSHGWTYVVVDARWYDAESPIDDRDFNKKRVGAKLDADEFGRLIPSLSRFPSSANGQGFKPLADEVHAMGLKFGLHMMRGIPKQAFNARTPIQGGSFTAADAGDPTSLCSWCPDMFGVKNNAAGQAWYDSNVALWASWGLDFVKVDDLSSPYHGDEIEMIRKAIDKCGRPIVLSTSPGPTDPGYADHISKFANMWRVSNDRWDHWGDLDQQFDLLGKWQGVAGPGHYPDADMIPLGHIGIRCRIAGPDRQTRLTPDEQVTLMSLWVVVASPLMLGNNLPDTDDWTLSLITNDEVIAVDQDSPTWPAKRAAQYKGTEVWVRGLKDGSKAVALFNRCAVPATVYLIWPVEGLNGRQILRNLWQHKDIGVFDDKFSMEVPAHGAVLLRAIPTKLAN
jgi:alpha-galactosidase